MNKQFDFIIVGAGPSGSTISHILSNNKMKIALIDRASNKKKGKKNFIFNPYVNSCPSFYTPSFSDQLGGNSALWHKKIYLLSKEEFKKGNWPFEYSELLKYSKILAKKVRVNHKYLIYENLDSKNLYSQSIRANFSNVYDFFNINRNKNIKLFSNSSPIEISYKNKNSVNGVKILNKNSNEIISLKVNKGIIFCAGGLGNTHLLKNLFKELDKMTGKNLCDHPHIQLNKINSNEAKKYKKISKIYLFSKQKSGISKKGEFNSFVEHDKNFCGVQLASNIDPTLLLSRLYLKTIFFNLSGSPFNYMKYIMEPLMFVTKILFKIYYEILNFFSKGGKYSFEFFFSQKRDKKNMVKINKNVVDEFGLKKIDIEWNINKTQLKMYQRLVDIFFKDSKKKIKIKNFYKNIYVGLHPSCMNSFAKQKGNILDKNLKLKNKKNVYVCGSDVFPSNGFTNPTWTIMTLGTRLSFFLKKKFK